MAGPNRITTPTLIDAELSFGAGASISSFPANVISNQHISSTAEIDLAKLAQRVLAEFPIEATEWRVHDALQSLLPTISSADDLGVTVGAFGSDALYIGTGDLKAAGATTRRARVIRRLPPNYEAGETIIMRALAGMLTTVADTSATIDFEAFQVGAAPAVGPDLVTTPAASINSLVAADKDFTINGSSLNPSDLLDIRMTIAVNDAASVTAVIAAVFSVALACDTRG